RPTSRAEPVTRNTRIAAARSVSDEPMVDTSWAVHIRLKSRFRKMANIGRESIGRMAPRSGVRARARPFSGGAPAFAVDRRLAAAPPAAAVATERAVTGDDPMTGDHQADRAAADRATDGPRRPGLADHAGDLAVAGRRAGRDAPHGIEHEAIPC